MKTWIHLASLAILAAAIAACSGEEQPAADTVQPAVQEGTTATGKALKKPLAKGVDLSFAHHLRRDRVEEVKPGVFRRRVLIEYLEVEQQQAASALVSNMAEAGFKVVSERTDDKGRIRLNFQKGRRKIAATVRQGGKLQNPAATGAMLISIPAKAPKSHQEGQERTADPAQVPEPPLG